MTPNPFGDDRDDDNPFGGGASARTEQEILNAHERDMMGALFDPGQMPRTPSAALEEPQCDCEGKPVDMQFDSDPVDEVDADPGAYGDLQEDTPVVDVLGAGLEGL